MKRGIIAIAIILLIAGILLINNKFMLREVSQDKDLEFSSKMQVKSVFKQGEKIPVKYTADGDDINPPLEMTGIPNGTKSLVLIVDDPDAPAGDWVHWMVFNIPVSGNNFKIKENSVPLGIVGVNSWGRNDYGGPSPPSGVHRYFFKVYALDAELELDSSASKKDVLFAIEGHVFGKAELTGVYER